jgi:hypothetical protein
MAVLQHKCDMLNSDMVECRADYERRQADWRREMGQRTGAIMKESLAERERHSAELRAERERLDSEKARMLDAMHQNRLEHEKLMRDE